ncbi:unnamed protein product [Adineta steineri]|uniref:VWFA domain-containing protein n=2 Tax=Adineta steineri TaxID=433720 RepID=A0A814I1W3_9BILA|nr:unnamed protein product [Adineta steineri]CAF1266194.1 unnamed protein product [Adineta steineri]
MSSPTPSETPSQVADDCSICLSTLAPGTVLLTLSCNHKFHLQCLASNVQAQNKQCPLCRATIDASIVQLLAGSTAPSTPTRPVYLPPPLAAVPIQDIPSIEESVDEAALQTAAERLAAAQQAAATGSSDTENLSLITAVTTLEYEAQPLETTSNIYGLVTLQAPTIPQSEIEVMRASRIPLDLICVIDSSGSMSGEKMNLLKQTMVYIVEQLNHLDRMAIISFNISAVDRSHGLKRMNEQNQQILKDTVNNDIHSQGGTYIGSGIQLGIDLLRQRQTKNPLGAILVLTDGQDNDHHDYTSLMETLPEGVQLHSFGYGSDHTANVLVKLAEQGNGGTFTYIDEQRAIGSAFAMALGGLFTCVAKEIAVNIEFNDEYKITHFHSKYSYEPRQLPSNTISIKLPNLNADEKRNLVFQLNVPQLPDNQNVEMNSQQPMSQGEASSVQQKFESKPIGNVTITYIDPKTTRSLTTNPIEFQLIRASDLPANLLQVDRTLDNQRNRIETTQALEEAMAEPDFQRSRAILKAQAEKLKTSISAEDPFTKELIQDLEQSFRHENQYRSSHHNTYMSHQTERGTYSPAGTTSSHQYSTGHQRQLAMHISNKYFS